MTAQDELEQLSGSGHSSTLEEDIVLNVSAAILYKLLINY